MPGYHFTIHGFRSGVAVALTPEGVSHHEIMDHVGLKSGRSAFHYIKLKQVIDLAGAAATVADMPLETGEPYKRFNNLMGFRRVFQLNRTGLST